LEFRNFLTIESMAIDFDNFLAVYNECSFHESLESIMTPKNFDFSTVSKVCSLILILISLEILFFFGAKIIEWVFFIFRESRLAVSHSTSFGISSLIWDCSISRFGPDTNKLESSAKSKDERTVENLARSLMYTRKSRGPRIDPWGTPHLMYNLLDW
jgi:hypothetical protein